MTARQVLQRLRAKISEARSSNNIEDLEFYLKTQKMLTSGYSHDTVKHKRNTEIEKYKKFIINNLDKLKL